MELHGDKLFIRLYVVSRLGESITENCVLVMQCIAKDVTQLLELSLENIEIRITGTVSKNNNIARRDLSLDLRQMLNDRKITYE